MEDQKKGVFENVSWKDLVTILYFLGGLAGMWFTMTERILIMEQKIIAVEKELASIKSDVKENSVKSETAIKQLNTQVTEASILLMRHKTP